ncbi:MAG: recombinase family protein, partial [Dehalococcoidales bacterium]|nr:recombinase family protein [Dehalococcoidales bacterium]
PEGSFLWDLNAILARYESLKTGARLSDMHARLAREGRWHGGEAPFGWRRVKDEEGARLVLEPAEATWRHWCHERYQAGYPVQRLVRELNEAGVRSRRGRPWATAGVVQLLTTPYNVGARLVDGELAFGGNIEPCLDLETYQRTLALYALRRQQGFRPGREPKTALGGRLVRCGTCGERLYLHWNYRDGVNNYQCEGRLRGLCSHGVCIREAKLRAYVEPRLIARLTQGRPQMPEKPQEDVGPILADLERQRASQARLVALYADGGVTREEFEAGRKVQRARLLAAEERLARVAVRLETAPGPLPPELSAAVAARWPDLTAQEQRDIYRAVVDHVIVYPASHTPRMRIVWR